MVDCLSCAKDGSKELRITNIEFNRVLQENDQYQLIVRSKMKTWFGSYYGRICLFESGELIAESGSIKFSGGQETTTWFTGYMLDRNMNFKVSLQLEAWGFIEVCQDARDFSIELSNISEPPTDPYDTGISESEPPTFWERILGNDDDDDDDDNYEPTFLEKYMDDIFGENTIMIMVLGVAVILIILIARK